MRNWITMLVATVGLVLGMAGEASAQQGGDFALLAGSGIDMKDSDVGALGTGIGARAGYTWQRAPLYSGLIATYYFGDRGRYLNRPVRSQYGQIGLEMGPVWQAHPRLVIRPLVGVGASIARLDPTLYNDDNDVAEAGAFVAPGLSILVPYENLRFGVDGRYTYVAGEIDSSTVSVFATVGFVLEPGGGQPDTQLVARRHRKTSGG